MTKQEIFDKALKGIREQGVQAINPDTEICQYRTTDPNTGATLMCAVGQVLGESRAGGMPEDCGVNTLPDGHWFLEEFRPHMALLEDIQDAHDNPAGPDTPWLQTFNLRMSEVAQKHNLTYEAPK